MILTVDVWEGVSRLAKSGTAGYQDEEEFNSDLNAVQIALMSMLAPMYSTDQVIKDILGPFIEPLTGTSSATGVLAKPSDYFQLATVAISGYPAFSIDVSEIQMLQFIPSRRPSATDNRYYYFMQSDSINLLPSAVHTVTGTYIRQPDEASIILTPVSEDDRDYVTPTSTDNLEWPQRVFNIIVYMMLLKLGLSFEKQLIMEFAQLGINTELLNINIAK